MPASDAARIERLPPGFRAPGIEALARVALHQPDLDLGSEIEGPLARAFGAFREGAREPVGFILGLHVADELQILTVFVDDRARRLGVGSALVEAALADAREAKLRLALLEVRRSNVAAIRLYRRASFVAVRLRAGYYESPADDAVEMAAELEPGALAAFDRIQIDRDER